MRIVICEDNESMQEQLKAIITDWSNNRMFSIDIDCFPNAEAFVFAWPDTHYDLAFLDIEMMAMKGTELARYIRQTDKNIQIVFITSHRQYALTGYDVNALHYLIKPASASKILPILDKAYSIWKTTHASYIIIPEESGKRKVSLGDVFSISMDSHTAKLSLLNETYEVRRTLDDFINELPANFMRIHRSHIVNLYKIDSVYKDSLVLSNNEKLPISRSNVKDVTNAFIKQSTLR